MARRTRWRPTLTRRAAQKTGGSSSRSTRASALCPLRGAVAVAWPIEEYVMNRRDTLKILSGAALAGFAGSRLALAQQPPGPFTLPPLGYPFAALEPYIDTTTMRIHHDAHHAAYVNNLNNLAAKWPDLAKKPMDEILANLSIVPGELRTGVRNNLGGHWNHTFFWELMTPGGAKAPTEAVDAAIRSVFSGADQMK